ncbi:MAG TPA: POTRA domain-containing protein [Verrucomicrobiae bacterium]|jgi:hemolysin activation/secretion protein|nr:POTRA domain-containing protein [Verrucomicrobiae bacterium]
MNFSVACRLSVLLFFCWMQSLAASSAADSNSVPRFHVEGYLVNDTVQGTPKDVVPMFSAYTGTNVSVDEIVHAASDLQTEYARRGYPSVSVAIGANEISNGIVTMHVFRSAVPQIRISGKRYSISSNEVAEISNVLAPYITNVITCVPAPEPAPVKPLRPVRTPTPEQEELHRKMAELEIAERKALLPPQPPPTTQLILGSTNSIDTNDVQLALSDKMVELSKQARRAQLLPPSTNSVPDQSTNKGPVFEVKGFELVGNTLLDTNLTELILQPYIGTNVTFEAIRQALTDLQVVYREHGFATVSVTLPQQTLSDKIVKIRVFEGRLTEIAVVNNRYFTSNNIMRALPSLHPNMILSEPVFQAELDRANANQDRQIYPAIEPGFLEGTSLLKLDVKDRFPFHAKTELNNQNSPGTPDLRVNSSAEYKDFWNFEHSLGVQYSFSPESYKAGFNWKFYDKPLVANYSGFYRMPLGSDVGVQETIASTPGNFGFDEATRRFNLPPPSGRLELNLFASRSTIDTGVTTLANKSVLDVPGVISIREMDNQQDLTVNNDLGTRLSIPRSTSAEYQSTLSGGFDFKTYRLSSFKTNNFLFSIITRGPGGDPNPPIISTVTSPNPPPRGVTVKSLEYFPLSLRYDAVSRNRWGTTTLGFGAVGDLWYSGTAKELQAITGSRQSQGHWLALTPSVTHDFILHTNWTLSVHADAQMASEPLISNEQFGAGGVNSVRGYREGEVFGDSGWRTSLELKTPPHLVGIAYNKQPMVIRGSVFMDYAQTFLLDPQGRPSETPLWGCGFGGVVSVGPHWDGRLIFAWPLLSTPGTPQGAPRFNFALTAQF